ncbi:Bug family tripartite tricarboxylate transporter substrate binding protein [Sabulicella glaciei]|uniref:Tripartite tricarboxylate transporter substrate binding protein n=1 Tax=Sabulicella glaciei TaxID=2984948 RepID=A0ABT3NWT1_9PROT|nr:tripartite tricarboxylate transporter substrate binding protein [Roseococcus sp. MDT2-1-1]MCW8086620.1 tripartite tricarboxylate transporter substrate binding protein [Roseococcus sp. MDT2-1-1]
MARRRTLLALPALLATAPRAGAQPAWPDRPIAIVVGFLPGGSVDIGARLLADRIAPRLGPQARIIIENRPGAGGSLAAEYVARQPADGHVLTVSSASSHGTNPAALPDTVRYDPVGDFSHLAVIGGGPMCIVVPGASPHRSIAALAEAAKAARAPLLWGSSGSGGIGHLTGELFAHRAGFRGEYVPYRGGSAVLEAMRKAEIDFSVEVLASAMPHLRDGSSRALAVTSPGRHPLLPDVASLQEQGFAGFDIVTWNVLQGPRGIPDAVAGRINRAATEAMAEPDLRRRLAAAGIDPAEPSTPDSTREFVAAELRKFQGIVRETGLRLGRG